MGDNNGPKKGGGKGDVSKFAKTALSWFYKPCNWRNPVFAGFCSHCGKAKESVLDKNRDKQRDRQGNVVLLSYWKSFICIKTKEKSITNRIYLE